jgi:hypothetical protein
MPHKKIETIVGLGVPAWMEELDPCLYNVVLEAIVARHAAERAGAMKYAGCRAAIESADVTLDMIADGRTTGTAACKKAVDAVRKYTQALEGAMPSTRRRRAA